MIFFTSDTHFGHTNIIKYCNRPFVDKEEMNKVLIENWNSVVKPEDTVYHLGDVSFMKQEESYKILKQLNGRKILIRGNHDKGLGAMRAMGFDEAYEKHSITLKNGLEINLSHYPYKQEYENDPHVRDKLLRRSMSDDGKILVCGHVHDNWKVKKGRYAKQPLINVGVDVWDFKPVSEDELIKFIEENK